MAKIKYSKVPKDESKCACYVCVCFARVFLAL